VFSKQANGEIGAASGPDFRRRQVADYRKQTNA
jgi:hypothetical protein